MSTQSLFSRKRSQGSGYRRGNVHDPMVSESLSFPSDIPVVSPLSPTSRALQKGWKRWPKHRWLALCLLGVFGLFDLVAYAAPVKYRYPLATPSNWTTYRDGDSSGGIVDWNGGKLTYNGHEGTDFALPKGSPIYAAADGKVEEVIDGNFDDCRTGSCAGPSNRVRLKHSDGQVTYYLHMKKFSIVVKVGQQVKCGDKLGEVASSGMSTGNHLHFQVGPFRGSIEPFKGPRGAASSLWTSQGGYGRTGVVPGSQCDGTKPECTTDADCKDAAKPRCVENSCVPKPPEGCAFVQTVRLGGLTLRVRAQPNTTSSVVGQVPEGVCLDVLQKAQGENVSGNTTWYQIKYNGVTGWVSGAFADCSSCGGECKDSATQACYTGPAGTDGKGICKAGTQTCAGGKWGNCAGEVKPQAEACQNGKDDDCNGQVDDGCPPPGDCTDGQTQACYTGPAGTSGQGECKDGMQTCTGGKWGNCEGEVTPQTEICNNGKDENCDGQVDENCQSTGPCEDKDGDGFKAGPGCPVGTILDCDDSHPLINPNAKETCGNGVDEDCDGFDLKCKAFGEPNCAHDGECITRLCLIKQNTSICTQPCKVGECPAGYTCLEGEGCWPTQPPGAPENVGNTEPSEDGGGLISIGCRDSTDCKGGLVCISGTCKPSTSLPKVSGCGCETTHISSESSWPLVLLLLCCLLLGLRQRAGNSVKS